MEGGEEEMEEKREETDGKKHCRVGGGPGRA